MVQLNKDIINKLNQLKYFLNDDDINSVDDLINKLIDDYSINKDIIIDNKDVSTVRVNKSTLNRLDSIKYYPTESYNSIIFRLLYDL